MKIKKIHIFALLPLMLAGCGSQDYSFEQAAAMRQHATEATFSGVSLLTSPWPLSNETNTLSISGSNLTADLNFRGQTDSTDLQSQRLITGHLTTTLGEVPLSLSGNVALRAANQTLFVLPHLSSGATLFSGLNDRRLSLTASPLTTPQRPLSGSLRQALADIPLFLSWDQRMVDGHTTYAVTLNPEALTRILPILLSNATLKSLLYGSDSTLVDADTAALGQQLQMSGYLEVMDSDTVRLVIDHLWLDPTHDLTIAGYLDSKGGLLDITKGTSQQEFALTRTVSYSWLGSPTIVLQATYDDQDIPQGSMDATLTPSSSSTKAGYRMIGKVTRTNPDSRQNQPFSWDFSTQTYYTPSDAFSVTMPTGAIDFGSLLSRVLPASWAPDLLNNK